MSASLAASSEIVDTDGNGSISIPPPSGLSAGDLWLVIVVADIDAGGTATVNVPSGFTAVSDTLVGQGTGYPCARAFGKIATGSETTVAVTYSTTGGITYDAWAQNLRITGADAATWLGNVATATPTDSSSTQAAPSVTVQDDGNLVVTWLACNRVFAITQPNGTTLLDTQLGGFPCGAVAYASRNAGAYSPGNWTLTGIDRAGKIVQTIEIRAAAEGGAFTLNCDAGSYALTGQDVTLTHSAAPVALDAEPGSYALTGQAVGMSAARVLGCEPGTYVLTGSDAAVDTAITASPGSYALTGQDVQLGAARVMSAAPGSYVLTGQAVNLTTASILSAEPGVYALTGQPATLRATHPALSAQAGVYALTGQDVTLTHGAIGAFMLVAERGAYTLTGQAAILGAAYRLAAAFGTYAYTGQDATLHATRGLTCEFGSYVLTGQDLTLTAPEGELVLTPVSRRVLVKAPSRIALVRPRAGITIH